MFPAEIYAKRRAELRRRVGGGLMLLPGNFESPMNYPNNAYHYRQDSTFLYFFGQSIPALAGVIDADSGAETLYGDDFTVDDIIWMGPQPSVADLAAEVGVSQSKPMAALEADLRRAVEGRCEILEGAAEESVYRTLKLHVERDEEVRQVIDAANRAVELRSFREIIPSMNDIFIRAVNGQL